MSLHLYDNDRLRVQRSQVPRTSTRKTRRPARFSVGKNHATSMSDRQRILEISVGGSGFSCLFICNRRVARELSFMCRELPASSSCLPCVDISCSVVTSKRAVFSGYQTPSRLTHLPQLLWGLFFHIPQFPCLIPMRGDVHSTYMLIGSVNVPHRPTYVNAIWLHICGRTGRILLPR